MPPSPVSTRARPSPFHRFRTRPSGIGSMQRAARCPPSSRAPFPPADTTSGIPDPPARDLTALERQPVLPASWSFTTSGSSRTFRIAGVARAYEVQMREATRGAARPILNWEDWYVVRFRGPEARGTVQTTPRDRHASAHRVGHDERQAWIGECGALLVFQRIRLRS